MSNFAPSSITPSVEPPKPFSWKLFGIVLAGLVLLVIMFFVGLWFGSTLSGDDQSEGLPTVEDVIEDEESIDDATDEEPEAGQPATATDAQTLNIEWVDPEGQKSRGTNYGWNDVVFGSESLRPEDGIGPKAFGLGTVRGGAYDGRELQLYIAGRPGLGVFYEMFYLIVGDGNQPIVVLDRYASGVGEAFSSPTRQQTASELLREERLSRLAEYSQDYGDLGFVKIILDSGARIAELDEAATVSDSQGRNFKLVGEWKRIDYPIDNSFVMSTTTTTLMNGRKMFESKQDTNKPFADNLFFYTREDGRLVFYALDLGIGIDQADGQSAGTPSVIWNNGTNNTEEYTLGAVGGCGASSSYHTVSDDVVGVLRPSGYYFQGETKVTVYEPVNYSVDYFGFARWQAVNPDGTIADYTALHPYFYVRDAFDRLVQFQRTSLMPAAECGKPVIYLYPTKTTDLDVTLKPVGGFTYTEPVYQNGWRVTASPDGTLMNRDDGQTYPYLFWEGRGGLYSTPTKFWVVQRADVHSFLVSTLAKLGLNQKETADFLEFWEPRMQAAPYYQIGFHGTNVMNQLAPLTLSQKADTTIRVLMDYQELSAPIKANPPILPATPARKGFTVIEWGGVIR
jgi:hypothetical protein